LDDLLNFVWAFHNQSLNPFLLTYYSFLYRIQNDLRIYFLRINLQDYPCFSDQVHLIEVKLVQQVLDSVLSVYFVFILEKYFTADW